MRHAFVDLEGKTMCSRCGNEVLRVDEDCPAISDGEIYKQGRVCPPTELWPAPVASRDMWPGEWRFRAFMLTNGLRLRGMAEWMIRVGSNRPSWAGN